MMVHNRLDSWLRIDIGTLNRFYDFVFSVNFRLSFLVSVFLLLSTEAAAFSYEASGQIYVEQSSGSTPLNSGDFNGDGRKDIVITKSGQYTHVLTQQSDGTLVKSSKMPTWLAHEPAPGWEYGYSVGNPYLNVGDMNNDEKDDIVITHSYGITSFIADASGGFIRKEIDIPYESGFTLRASILIDINNDGLLDLIAASVNGGLYYWLNKDGELLPQKNYMGMSRATFGPAQFAVGDLNSDGLVDFALVSTSYSPAATKLEIYRKKPDGTFNALDPIAFPVDTIISSIAIGDLNNDGRDDIAVTNSKNIPASVILVFLQTQNGEIGNYLTYAADHIPASILIHDMDGDGLNDLVTNHAGWGRVYTYLQQNGALYYQDPVCCNLLNNNDDPQAITAGDFNSDGCNDIILSAGGGYYFLKGKDCIKSVPAAPVITSIRAGDRSLTVSFKPPDNAGGQPILDYTAYCGDKIVSGISLSITVNELTNGVSYNCQVAARNASGIGPRSSVSGAVIPVPNLDAIGFETIEGHSGAHYAVFKAVLSGPAVNSGALFDAYTTSLQSNGRSAIANVDYIPLLPARITIPAGQSSIDIKIKILGDRNVEPDEVFTVVFGNAAGTSIRLKSAVGIIRNDDNARLATSRTRLQSSATQAVAQDCKALADYAEILEHDVVARKIQENVAISEILRTEKLAKLIGCGIR